MVKIFLVLADVEYCDWLDMIHYGDETICLPKGTAVEILTSDSKYLGEIYKYDGTSKPHIHWFGALYSDGEKYYLLPKGEGGWWDD
jgi:hypothetical protein